MKFVLALAVLFFAIRAAAQEEPLVISIEAPKAWDEAMNLLAQYYDRSYIYEEEIIPHEAFHEIGLRLLHRRSTALSFTIDPAGDMQERLQVLREAIIAQETTWPVRAVGLITEDIPILVISDARQIGGKGKDGKFGLARPRAIAGSFSPVVFNTVLARAQEATLKELGVRLISVGGVLDFFTVMGEVGGEIAGDWPHPRAGVIALIQHAERERQLRFGYQIWVQGHSADAGEYSYLAQILGSNRRPQYPNLAAGGRFVFRDRNDLDLASAEILARENNAWVFVVRQQPTALSEYYSIRESGQKFEDRGGGGVVFRSVDFTDHNTDYVPIGYSRMQIAAHCPPGVSMAEILEQAFNETHAVPPRFLSPIPPAYGPVRFFPREGGGHYLYFGAGLFLDPERSHDDHSFAQDLPALNIPPGVTLAAAVEQLYQALPETPEQGLMLAEGAWQEVILTEELSLGNRTFGSAVCDLFSAMGLPPGILRVHYGISEKSYIFTYHEPESD